MANNDTETTDDRQDTDDADDHRLREADREQAAMAGDPIADVDLVEYACVRDQCHITVSRFERDGEFDSPPEHPETVTIEPTPESKKLIDALTEDDDEDPDIRTDGGQETVGLDLSREELSAIRDVVAYASAKIDDSKHYALSEAFNTAADALNMDEVGRKQVPDGWKDTGDDLRTDGGPDAAPGRFA